MNVDRLSTDRLSPWRKLALAAALLVAGCAGADQPQILVGDLAVPADQVAALPESEREAFFDLVALGRAISAADADRVIEPFVARAEELSLVEALPLALGARASGMGEAELASAYDANPQWELEVRHMVRLVEEGDGATVRERQRQVAEQVAARAREGESLADLAAEFSEEPGAAARGGLLEPGRRGSWVDPFWEAAVALAPGETSGVVETEYGYHVLHLDDRRPLPLTDADRRLLLRKVVPAFVASGAMGEWASTDGAISLPAGAVEDVRATLADGAQFSPFEVSGPATVPFDVVDLVGGWGELSQEERDLFSTPGNAGLNGWLENEARTDSWAQVARGMELVPDPSVGLQAGNRWLGQLALLGQTFGFSEGLSDERIVERSASGALSGRPEARIGRRVVRALRPYLRQLYPVVLPAG